MASAVISNIWRGSKGSPTHTLENSGGGAIPQVLSRDQQNPRRPAQKENQPASLTSRDTGTPSKTPADRAWPWEAWLTSETHFTTAAEWSWRAVCPSQHRAHRGAHARSSQAGLPCRDEGEHPCVIRQACCLFLVLLSNTVLKSQCNKTGKRNKGTKIPKKEVKHSQMWSYKTPGILKSSYRSEYINLARLQDTVNVKNEWSIIYYKEVIWK